MRTSAPLGAVLFVALACSEPSAPPAPFALTLGVAQVYAAQSFDLPDGPMISCGVDFEAVVTGSGTAVWQGATFYWFAGGDRSVAVDSLRIGPITTRASWSADSISATDNKLSAWTFSGRAPFDAEAHFRYAVVGETGVRTAGVRFSCGPKLPVGGVAAPVVSADPPSVVGDVEPGDTIRVTYRAMSPFGLWTTGLLLDEAWETVLRFADHMALDVVRTVDVVVPLGARLGVPFTIKAFAEDGGLQATVLAAPGTMQIVDLHAPVITENRAIEAQYSVGDVIDVAVAATDNNQLGWLVYTLGAPANVIDSVRSAADVPVARWSLPLVVQPGWVGTPTFTVFVRDMAGHASAVVDMAPGGLTILPTP